MKTHTRSLTAGYAFCVCTAQVLDGDFKCSACTCGHRPPHSFRIWKERALTIHCSQLHCCALYCSEAAELRVWCDLCDAFQPTRGKLGLINAGHLTPQSAFYLFLQHHAAQTEIVVLELENLMLKGHVGVRRCLQRHSCESPEVLRCP